ncbi:C-type lectin domain family 4 member A [Cebidichthys violaceus]|uniref:C-type lectin domain family 4 member A n=1 Tax=Cebidichthys violaceus TaxID=271503 RepID=UPI0035C9B376
METEIVYSTVVFNNSGAAPKEKKEDPTIDSEVKPKEAATEPIQADGKAAARSHFAVLAACLVILCVLLVASIFVIIHFSFVMKEQRANLSNLTAENELLIEERSILSRVTDDLNMTLGVIMKFNTFPVNEYCPDKKCQPCRRGWILFQEKCHLFYEGNDWKTWKGSQEYCRRAAADLVVIDNLHEQEFISNHTEFYQDKYHGYWLGLIETKDNYWVWVDGRNDALGYWLKKNFGPPGHCGLMIPRMNLTVSWNQPSCEMKNKFICESDALTWSY